MIRKVSLTIIYYVWVYFGFSQNIPIYDIQADAFYIGEFKVHFIKYIDDGKKYVDISHQYEDENKYIIHQDTFFLKELKSKELQPQGSINLKDDIKNKLFPVEKLKVTSLENFWNAILKKEYVNKQTIEKYYTIIKFYFVWGKYDKEEKEFADNQEDQPLFLWNINKKYWILITEQEDVIFLTSKKNILYYFSKEGKQAFFGQKIKSKNKILNDFWVDDDQFLKTIDKNDIDSVTKYMNVFVAYQKQKITLYNLFAEKIKINNVRAFYEQHHRGLRPQMIVGNKVKYLNRKNYRLHNRPIAKGKIVYYFLCGLADNVFKMQMDKNKDSTYLQTFYSNKISYIDSTMNTKEWEANKVKINISEFLGKHDFYFLNNQKEYIIDSNDTYYKDIYIPFEWFYYKENNQKYSLVSLRFIEEKKAEVEILLKNLEEIKSSGYFYPIIYKKDSLWGIYPAQKQPKYKKLDKFVGYLARFETIEGKKGWVDYWGKEYYDE